MNGVKRGLFSNEAGSGSAPCAAAAAECDTPVKSRIYTGIGCIYRYNCDLQLYGDDHASCAGKDDSRTGRNGAFADSNELSSR